MDKYSAGNIIGMEILNIKVINSYWFFKKFMLNNLNYSVLAINQYKNISGAQPNCICPSLNRTVEWMAGCANNFFSVNLKVNQLVSFIDIGLKDPFQRNIPSFFIPSPNVVACLNILDCLRTGSRQNKSPSYKAYITTICCNIRSANHCAHLGSNSCGVFVSIILLLV